MNFRFTLALVAVFIVLGGGVWYFELRNPPKPAGAAASQAPVFDLKTEDVSRLEVQDSGKTAAVERGSDNVWRLAVPQPGEADNTQVDSAVGRVAKLTATRKLDNAGSLGDYGLASPTTRFHLKTKDGTGYELLVGAKTPDNSSYYVKRADQDPVYVVSAFAVSDLVKWTTDPPKPRPTPTPLPTLPASNPTASPAG